MTRCETCGSPFHSAHPKQMARSVRCPLLGGVCNHQGVLIGSCPNERPCRKLAAR